MIYVIFGYCMLSAAYQKISIFCIVFMALVASVVLFNTLMLKIMIHVGMTGYLFVQKAESCRVTIDIFSVLEICQKSCCTAV